MLCRHLLTTLSLAAIASGDNMQIFVWETEDCTGTALKPQLDLRLNVGCIRRGDVAQQLEVELLEGEERTEKAVSAVQDGSMQAQSQTLVFFTSDDCDPSTEIADAYVDDGCSGRYAQLQGDKWKSFEMRDACFGGLSGCDPGEEVQNGTACERPLLPDWPGCGEPLNKTKREGS